MNVLNATGIEIKANRMSIIQFMSLVEVGTIVRVVVPPRATIWHHKVCDAIGVMSFLRKMNEIHGHTLQVQEIRVFMGDDLKGIEVTCQ